MIKWILVLVACIGFAGCASTNSASSGAGGSTVSGGHTGTGGGTQAVTGTSASVAASSGARAGNGGSSATSAAGNGGGGTSSTSISSGRGGNAGASQGGRGGTATGGAAGDSRGGSTSTSTEGRGGSTGGSAAGGTGMASSTAGGGSLDAGVDARPGGGDAGAGSSLEQLQRDFVDLRFGMFIHFGILTYTGSWAQSNLDITQFNPTGLDCEQWATAAASAGMKYGALTTRHHDGFALWPSKAGKFNVANIPWKNGQGDVVRCYVDAFRKKGLLPGLYYSIFDSTQGVVDGPVSAANMTYLKTQITELLTNYGEIPILVIDGWSWKMGHKNIAYQEIYELVKSLQPNCLLTDHTHMPVPWNVDIVNFEEPKGAWASTGNTYPAQQGTKVNAGGGNDWFWAPNISGLMSVSDIVTKHLADLEPKWTNFLLNIPPNRTGTLDPAIVTLLGQVGAAWSPNKSRPPLPAQGPQNEHPYNIVAATATSGTAENAIDGINDSGVHTMWQSTGAMPQSITLDLGKTLPDVGWLGCSPYATGDTTAKTGNVTGYTVSVSTDGSTFNKVTSGTWAADGLFKVATFAPTSARYVRFQVDSANGSPAVTELTLGGVR